MYAAPESAAVVLCLSRCFYYISSRILSLLSPATSACKVPAPLSSFHTPLRHPTCEPCRGCIARCGLPRPHSKLGKSKPVQIWKSCIHTDLTTWATALDHSYTNSRGGWHAVGLQSVWGKYMSVCTCPGQYIWVNSSIIRKVRLGQGLGRSYNMQSGLSHHGYHSWIWLHPQTYQAPPENNLECVCMLHP